jgi:plasmid stability protein
VSSQSVTLRLPDPLYQLLKRRAEQAKRPVEDELLDVVAAAMPVGDDLPQELTEAISQLALLDDESLWRAARTRLPEDAAEELEGLHIKRQREGLSSLEAEKAEALLRH